MVIFPSGTISLYFGFSLIALVTMSETHSGGENQALKGKPNRVSKGSSEKLRLTSLNSANNEQPRKNINVITVINIIFLNMK